MEQIWCSLCKGADKVLVGCMYRPPGSEPRVLRELLKSIQRAKDRFDLGEFKSLIVCGDFNLPKVHWPEPGCWVNYGGQEEVECL